MDEQPILPLPPPVVARKPVWMGVLLCFALHLMWLLLGPAGLAILIGVGIVQVVYVIPAYIIAKNKGELDLAKGILIGAGITFLLNATCFGVVLLSMSGANFH